MFTDLGQFKAFLEKIDSFDQLYVIQQGGRGVTREQMIKRLRNELRNKVMDPSGSGVCEATPVIILEDGTEIVKGNNRGRSTFFPDDWDEERILKEVEHAIENNQGKKPDTWNTYTGKSMDEKVTINFFYENTLINSYYPVLTK